MKTISVCLILLSLASPSRADDCPGSQELPSAADLKAAEAACLKLLGTDEQLDCLDEISDGWFHAGEYTESVRILKIQMTLDPQNGERLSSMIWVIFSIEVNKMMAKENPDFTDSMLQELNQFEPLNRENFSFYYENLLMLRTIFINKYGTVQTKKTYYVEAMRYYAEAQRLRKTLDLSTLDDHTIQVMDSALKSVARSIEKFKILFI